MAVIITRADVERELLRELIAEELGIDTSAPSTPLWEPLTGPQTLAAASEADITGYGGAAGGGKSFLEIGLAVTQHRRSIIFRREADQTRDLWQKLSDVCGMHGRSNENLLIWRDLPGDRYVRLAGCKNPGDWKKFQGQAHDLYAFDEATEFLESQVRTLIAWNRTTLPNQRCRVLLAFNPPTTPEGEWVIQFFAPWLDERHPNPAEPGELRWYAVVNGRDVECESGEPFEHFNATKGETETIQPLSRTFFPAKLADNPLLEATGYRATLQGLPEPLRSQMLYGDFTVGLLDDVKQVIPTAWVRAAQDRWAPGDHDGVLTQIGFDVAQGGKDSTAIARRYGTWFDEIEMIPGPDVPDAQENANHVTSVLTEGGIAAIDSDGIGSSTYFLARALLGKRVRCYMGSEPTEWHDKAKVLSFRNTRAAAYWALREALDPANGLDIALPPDAELRIDLCAPTWERLPGGVIKLEAKKDIKARLGRSPDKADAVVMAWWTDNKDLIRQAYREKKPSERAAFFERVDRRQSSRRAWGVR